MRPKATPLFLRGFKDSADKLAKCRSINTLRGVKAASNIKIKNSAAR
jgi:hypothetical protein